MLVVTVGAARAVVDPVGHRPPVDRLGVLPGLLGVALAAGPGQVRPARSSTCGSAADASAWTPWQSVQFGGVLARLQPDAVDRLVVAGQDDRQPDVVGR